MDIKIYQINLDLDVNRLAFEPFDYVKSVDAEIYQRVFEGSVEAKDLEDVFRIFNIEKPEDYKGRSLSVSDVVEVIGTDGESTFHYCDSIGFQKVDFEPYLTETLKEEKIKVVLCEPGKCTKVAEIENTLEGLQAAVKGDIEAFYPFEEAVCIVCNEEGKFNGMEPNRAVYGGDKQIMDIIFGPFFICDCSGENFGSLSKEQLEKYSKKYQYPERLFRINGEIKSIPYKPEKGQER